MRSYDSATLWKTPATRSVFSASDRPSWNPKCVVPASLLLLLLLLPLGGGDGGGGPEFAVVGLFVEGEEEEEEEEDGAGPRTVGVVQNAAAAAAAAAGGLVASMCGCGWRDEGACAIFLTAARRREAVGRTATAAAPMTPN